MLAHVRPRLTYANVTATLALFLALGGGAYAATQINGKHLKEAKLTCRKAGGKQENFLVVTMSDVLISSYQTGGSQGGEVPMDQISLNYSKMDIDYLAQDEKGISKSAGKKWWDMKTNTGG